MNSTYTCDTKDRQTFVRRFDCAEFGGLIGVVWGGGGPGMRLFVVKRHKIQNSISTRGGGTRQSNPTL